MYFDRGVARNCVFSVDRPFAWPTTLTVNPQALIQVARTSVHHVINLCQGAL